MSGEYKPGDVILVHRWMYDSAFKAFHEYCGRLGAVFVSSCSTIIITQHTSVPVVLLPPLRQQLKYWLSFLP